VIGQEVVGGVLALLDALSGHVDVQERHEVTWAVSAGWARARVADEVVVDDWGSRAVPCGDQRGGGFSRERERGRLPRGSLFPP
jgi:hypothetical protein